MSDSGVTVYSTSWCGYCVRLKAQMKRAGIAFDEVDIETDPASEAWVKAQNSGNAVVPTLKFADGSSLTNPPLKSVQERLSSLAA